ncbi:MAG TPA: hypothetical protein VK459_25225 [Polyangiaceae bacterium]|nr:hypothetical protein [Polyangiaceae bacterium]
MAVWRRTGLGGSGAGWEDAEGVDRVDALGDGDDRVSGRSAPRWGGLFRGADSGGPTAIAT